MVYDLAYGPFGEPYATSGSTVPNFTGMNQDISPNVYDFPAREYGIQGRWPSPDPAGLAAVNPMDPQTWNRYAYVRNSPLGYIDPMGLRGVGLPPPFQDPKDPIGSNCTADVDGLDTSCIQAMDLVFSGDVSTINGNLVEEIDDSYYEVIPGLNIGASVGDDGAMESQSPSYEVWLGVDFGSAFFGDSQGEEEDAAISTGSLQFQAYEGMRLLRALTPTVCGGGAFGFAGPQGEKGKGQGFAGFLLDWDSRAGWSGHGLFEGGAGGTGGGLVTNPLEGLLFLPVGHAAAYGVPLEFGGFATTSAAVGGYGEVGYRGIGFGLGGYVNISTVGGCS